MTGLAFISPVILLIKDHYSVSSNEVQLTLTIYLVAICFAQILLDDINDFSAMNEVYGAWVSELLVKPARAAFAAAALPAGALVEIVVQGTR